MRSPQHHILLSGLVCMLLVALACAGDGTAGRADKERPASLRYEPIDYRALTADDFRASRLPRHLEKRDTHTAAYLCAAIAGKANLDVEIYTEGDRFSAAIVEPAYGARMNPGCSFLDPRLDRNERRYALEHEQVHFALLELEARRVNEEIRAIRITVDAVEEAAPAAQNVVERLLEAARSRYLERSQRFDAEASHPSKQAAQTRWRTRVEERLANTSR